MKEKLTNNLGLKILSICLAFFTWLLVVNVSNPETTGTKEVPVEILNEDILEAAGQTYEILGKSTVTVTYRVQTLNEYKVRASDFKATVDLADYYPVTGTVPVTVEVVGNQDIILGSSAKPQVIRIETEELQRKSFDLDVRIVGEAKEGYVAGDAVISPNYVYVKGPVSLVGQISSVGIEIDVTDQDSDMVGTAQPKLYDANGNEILQNNTRVTVNYEEIDYTLPILREKTLALNFEVSGNPAGNYRFTGVESEIQTVAVEGLRSTLASLSTITISGEDLSVEGATADRTVTLNLNTYLPDGVELASGVSSMITVTLKIEQLETKLYSLEMQDLTLTGENPDYHYEIVPDALLVTIRGLSEDLQNLTTADLNASIDVTYMNGGTHEGRLTFQLNDGFEVMEYSDFEVVVSPRSNSSRSDSESGSETGGETADETDAQESQSGTET